MSTAVTNPMSELLPWLFLTDSQDIVVCKDSSLLASYVIAGLDAESTTSYGLENVALSFDKALRNSCVTPVRVWTRVDRRISHDYPTSTISNPMAAEIDALWANTFRQNSTFVNHQTLSFAMPTQKRERTVAEMTRDYIDSGENTPKALWLALKDRFGKEDKHQIGFDNKEALETACARLTQNILVNFERQCEGIAMHRLEGDALCGYLKFTTSTGEPGLLTADPYNYLDVQLTDTWINNQVRDYLVLEGTKRKYVAVLSLKSAPSSNLLTVLDPLLQLPIEMTVATCWLSSDKNKAVKDLRGARTFDELSNMDVRSMLKSIATQDGDTFEDDAPKSETAQVAAQYIQGVKSGVYQFGSLAGSIIIYADTIAQLEQHVDAVQTRLVRSGLNFLREREGQISGFAVGIPGNVIDPVRWFNVEAGNVTDLAPLITLSPGDEHHPHLSAVYGHEVPSQVLLRTRYNTAYHCNTHVGALGHRINIGPSRNGKTMFEMFLTSQLFKYDNARAIIFDKDFSCEAPVLLHDGTCIDLSPNAADSVKMNPLKLAKNPAAHAWITGWIDRLCASRGARLTDVQIERVSNAIKSVATLNLPRLSSLSILLDPELQSRLSPWCQGGIYGGYFDNIDDDLHFKDTIICFEVGTLITSGLTDVLRAFTDYVFYRLEDTLNAVENVDHVGPTQIYFEEAGFLLEDPIFTDRAVDYLMTLAKKNAFLSMTAQSPEPFLRNTRLRSAVRDNVATIVFLPNANAERGELAHHYKDVFGLDDNHLTMIANAQPRREYCIWQRQTDHFRVAVCDLPPEIVARLRSDKKSRAILDTTYRPSDPTWKQRYIAKLLE